MRRYLPKRRDVVTFACVFGLLGAVTLLPPDTALREVRAAGVLRACVPAAYPPLVTGDPARPGFDVELLQAIAASLRVRLDLVVNPAMGRDFNPRAWRITRAQCEVLAGGVVDSTVTRSFLETTPAYAATGWGWLAPQGPPRLEGARVGVLVSVSGLDRVGLGTQLRASQAVVTVVTDGPALLQGVRDGRFSVGVTERLQADALARPEGWQAGWLPGALPRYSIVIGLWKGDLTLKRAMVAALDGLRADGTIGRLSQRYGMGGEAVTTLW